MIDKITHEEKIAALNTPHNLMIADKVIDISVNGFTSSITIGFLNPAKSIQPVATFSMPTDVLYDLGNEIINAVKANSAEIKNQHQALDNII